MEEAVHKQKRGELKSGSKGPKVKSRKQAIAIGLSEAREKGAKVPPPKESASAKKSAKKPDSKSSSRKKATTKKAATKKKAAPKKKAASKKAAHA